jgi:hypothetical protein
VEVQGRLPPDPRVLCGLGGSRSFGGVDLQKLQQKNAFHFAGALNLISYLSDQVLRTVRDIVPPGRAEFERPLHHLPADGQFARLVPERLEAAQPDENRLSVKATLGCMH